MDDNLNMIKREENIVDDFIFIYLNQEFVSMKV